jgi:hypothetical protein
MDWVTVLRAQTQRDRRRKSRRRQGLERGRCVGSMDETRCSPPSRAAISSTLVAHARPFRFAQSCAAIATPPSGRTPGTIGSLVSDPLNQSDFVGWKRGPLGLFFRIGSRNQRFEPHQPRLHTHKRKSVRVRQCVRKVSVITFSPPGSAPP